MIKLNHICTGHNAALYTLQKGKNEAHFLSAGGDGWVTEWEINQPDIGKVIASIRGKIFSLYNLQTENLLVAGDMDGGLHWIYTDQNKTTQSFLHHKKGVFALLFAENELFSGGGDGVVTAWDYKKVLPKRSVQISKKAIRNLVYSQQQQVLATATSEGDIFLLNLETLEIIQKITAAHLPSVFALDFSPDGKYLVSGGRDAMMKVWEIANEYKLVLSLPAHLYTINDLKFDRENKFLASASRDKTIKIWDAKNFELLKVLDVLKFNGHVNSVNRLLWQGNQLISCSDDRTIRIWSGIF